MVSSNVSQFDIRRLRQRTGLTLNANSPCVNTGTNQSWMTDIFDLDGQRRIRYGIVDVDVYERIYNGTIYGVH